MSIRVYTLKLTRDEYNLVLQALNSRAGRDARSCIDSENEDEQLRKRMLSTAAYKLKVKLIKQTEIKKCKLALQKAARNDSRY